MCDGGGPNASAGRVETTIEGFRDLEIVRASVPDEAQRKFADRSRALASRIGLASWKRLASLRSVSHAMLRAAMVLAGQRRP